jgi:hypothetical protein
MASVVPDSVTSGKRLVIIDVKVIIATSDVGRARRIVEDFVKNSAT